MLHFVSRKDRDDERLTHVNESQESSENDFDYSNIIVKKPWGYEYLVFENEHVAIWMLHIVRKRKTSLHCHPRKTTGLIVLAGNATFTNLESTITLNALDGVMIEAGSFHSTEASSGLPIDPVSEDGIWVMEIEAPPLKNDLMRFSDNYGRSGASYEGTDQMVFDVNEYLRFEEPEPDTILQQNFYECLFSIGCYASVEKIGDLPPDTLISIIATATDHKPELDCLQTGSLSLFKDFARQTEGVDLCDYTILVIERRKMSVKLSDYIFSSIAKIGITDVFAVCGGGAMHLVDSLGKCENLNYIATHHEQAAAMAAEGYARVTGKPGAALVTSGPGGTNTLTGVCGAWIDSIPAIFISGQVTSDTLIGDSGLRQMGIQESNIIELVKPVTKYAVTVTDPLTIKYHLEKAIYLAVSGRPGPVWLDIPLDVQSKVVNLEELEGFTPPEEDLKKDHLSEELAGEVQKCLTMLQQAKRPVLISGYGIRLAKAEKEFLAVVKKLKIPVISSWTSSDLIDSEDEFSIGRSGIMGDRAGNFTIQNSDLLLIIGSRMSIPQIGYNYKAFARESRKIMVDVDIAELSKKSLQPDLPIQADAGIFLEELNNQLETNPLNLDCESWLSRCRQWKEKYPVCLPEYAKETELVNSFYFVDQLAKRLDNEAVIVTDMGTSFTCTMQAFKIKSGQRLFTSSGHSSMGYGLPGAIGACVGNNSCKTICISGDGGLQMNIQELQTMVHYKLPIILFVLNNGGYLTIKLMQQNHFGRYVGSETASGLSCPDIVKLADAYGIKGIRIKNNQELEDNLDSVLAAEGPMICEIMMPEEQPLIPRVSSLKRPDGSIIAKPLEDLYPFLDRKEFLENMIVKPIEVFK
jgi:acetolactate synthase I/II/III large subunit